MLYMPAQALGVAVRHAFLEYMSADLLSSAQQPVIRAFSFGLDAVAADQSVVPPYGKLRLLVEYCKAHGWSTGGQLD